MQFFSNGASRTQPVCPTGLKYLYRISERLLGVSSYFNSSQKTNKSTRLVPGVLYGPKINKPGVSCFSVQRSCARYLVFLSIYTFKCCCLSDPDFSARLYSLFMWVSESYNSNIWAWNAFMQWPYTSQIVTVSFEFYLEIDLEVFLTLPNCIRFVGWKEKLKKVGKRHPAKGLCWNQTEWIIANGKHLTTRLTSPVVRIAEQSKKKDIRPSDLFFICS